MTYYEMKTADIRILKEKIWLANEKKCPVLGFEISLDKMALDHAHKRKDEEYATDKGVIREALDFRSNAVLGKLENSIKRTGLDKMENFNISTFLRNAADYFEKGSYTEVIEGELTYFVHPKEVKKEPKCSKKNYNKLAKLYKEANLKAKFPNYPTTGKLTKPLQILFEKFNISPFN